MSKEATWEFASTGGGREDGIHNSMIEHFAGNYNYSLAREIIQNSLDAKQEGSADPVTVVFKLEEFTKNQFPGYSELLEVLNACKEYYKSDNDTQEFIEKALQCIGEDTIPFLKISDFNTKGLLGADDDKKGGWYNLVKSTGASSKSESQGGSFGIGKGAPFAASNLRVVFYSTLKGDGFTKFQGIAELVSHEVNKDIKRGVGSFGRSQNSLFNPKDIPEKFRRKEKTGTDIFIAGYKNEKGWQRNLVQSVLRNFWYAISKKDLIVKIEDQEISSITLEKLLVDNFLNEKFKDEVKPKGNPLQYYKAFKEGKEFVGKLKSVGEVKFYFYQTEEHLNHVAMLRNSHMVIYSRRFNFPGNYAGVFICDDEEGSRILRKMEPPAHDEWIPERNKERGAKTMDEITSFIRDCLDQMKITKTSGILDIPELYKYLPYDDGEETGNGARGSKYTGEESEEESSKMIQKREVFNEPSVIQPYKVTVINSPDTGNGDGAGSGSSGGGKGGSSGSGGQGGKRRSFKREEVETRSFLLNKKDHLLEYAVLIKSKIKAKCNLKLTAVGEEGSEKIKITKVIDSSGHTPHFNGNSIHSIPLEKNKDTKLIVTIESSIKYSLKIEIYDLQ